MCFKGRHSKKEQTENRRRKKKATFARSLFFDAAAAAFIPFLRFWLLFRIKKNKRNLFYRRRARARVYLLSRHY